MEVKIKYVLIERKIILNDFLGRVVQNRRYKVKFVLIYKKKQEKNLNMGILN